MIGRRGVHVTGLRPEFRLAAGSEIRSYASGTNGLLACSCARNDNLTPGAAWILLATFYRPTNPEGRRQRDS